MAVKYIGGKRRGVWVARDLKPVQAPAPVQVVLSGNFVEVVGRRRSAGVCW